MHPKQKQVHLVEYAYCWWRIQGNSLWHLNLRWRKSILWRSWQLWEDHCSTLCQCLLLPWSQTRNLSTSTSKHLLYWWCHGWMQHSREHLWGWIRQSRHQSNTVLLQEEWLREIGKNKPSQHSLQPLQQSSYSQSLIARKTKYKFEGIECYHRRDQQGQPESLWRSKGTSVLALQTRPHWFSATPVDVLNGQDSF